MKKKTWLIAAGAAALLAVTLLILLIIGNRQGKPMTADPESRYPYTVRQTKQGMLVTISDGMEGYRWNAVSDDPYVVYPVEKSEAEQKYELLLSPVTEGNANITITLVNRESPYDAAYQLSLMVRTAENSTELLNAEHRAYPGVIRDKDDRYTISSMEDGSYLVCMTKSEESEWVASLASGSADVKWYQPSWMSVLPEQTEETETEESTETETWFQISDNGAEYASVCLHDRKQGNLLVLDFSRNTDGVFMLETHEMQTNAEITAETSSDPVWELPAGTALLECGTVELYSQENGHSFQADTAVFILEGTVWELLRAEGETRKALALRDYRMSEEVPDEENEAEIELDTLWVYRTDGQWYCAWEHEGAAYLLKGSDTVRDTVETIAGMLLEQTP